ncbi:aspartate aminotransferase family protein, partial [Acinetobacter baumannii]
MDVDHLPHTLQPNLTFTKGCAETGGAELANEMPKLIDLHDATNIAAVNVEPISGAAGCIVPPTGYLQRVREICDQHDILLIFDEVITGLGRLGTWTAAGYFADTPDILN